MPSGVLRSEQSNAGANQFEFDYPSSTTYTWDSSAGSAGIFEKGVPTNATCAVITSEKFVCIPQSGAPGINIYESNQP
jgi:hypothetical protein